MTALLRGWLDTRCSFWFIAPVHEAFVWKACSPWVQLAGARAGGAVGAGKLEVAVFWSYSKPRSISSVRWARKENRVFFR